MKKSHLPLYASLKDYNKMFTEKACSKISANSTISGSYWNKSPKSNGTIQSTLLFDNVMSFEKIKEWSRSKKKSGFTPI